MSSSSSSKNKTLGNYSNVPTTVTKTVTKTWTMEDNASKVTITDEESHKAKISSDRLGNLRLDHEYGKKTTEMVRDKCEGTVEKFTHQAATRGSGGAFEKAPEGTSRVVVPTSDTDDDDDDDDDYEKMSHQFIASVNHGPKRYNYNQYNSYDSDSDSDGYY